MDICSTCGGTASETVYDLNLQHRYQTTCDKCHGTGVYEREMTLEERVKRLEDLIQD